MKQFMARFAQILVVSSSAVLLQANIAGAQQSMQVYFGNLHSHTKYSDGTGTPRDAFQWARDVAKFDFYAVTDHGEMLDPYEWWKTGQYASDFNQEGVFAAIRGFEWSHPIAGHISVWSTSRYTNAVIDYTLSDFYDWLDKENGTAQFNHPGREPGVFHDFDIRSHVMDNLVALETGNKDSGNLDVVDAFYEWYIVALDNGWQVAPVYGQDNHDLILNNGGSTAIIAPALTRTDLMTALRERRVYSTDDPNMLITFKLEDQWLGSTVVVPAGSAVTFTVVIEDDEPITKAELVTSSGAVVTEQVFAPSTTYAVWNPTVQLSGEPYLFLRVTAEDWNNDMPGYYENAAYTAPFWFTYH